MNPDRTGDDDRINPSTGLEGRPAGRPVRPRRGPERPTFSAEEAAAVIEHRLHEIRMREERATAMLREARTIEARAEVKLAEARDMASRAQQAGPVVRSSANRDHELTQMKAKLANGETAGADLAERLRFAYLQAGKPSLTALGVAVGCSKATLSKVFNNRMPPRWLLVRKLGAELRVPQSHVLQEWRPLWIAARDHQHRQVLARGRATAPPSPVAGSDDVVPATGTAAAHTEPTGHTCPKCGSWVVDTAQHVRWHMAMEPGAPPPAVESLGGRWPGEPAAPSPGILRGDEATDLSESAADRETASELLRRGRADLVGRVVQKDVVGITEQIRF